MNIKLQSLLVGTWLSVAAWAGSAQAADFSFELAGRTADASFWQQGGYALGQLPLTDAASGGATLPGFVISTIHSRYRAPARPGRPYCSIFRTISNRRRHRC